MEYTEAQIREFARDEIKKWAKKESKALTKSFDKLIGDVKEPYPPCINYLEEKQKS